MYESLMSLDSLHLAGKGLFLLALFSLVLILETVFLLLFAGERTRAREYEVNSRRKLGHDPPERAELIRVARDKKGDKKRYRKKGQLL